MALLEGSEATPQSADPPRRLVVLLAVACGLTVANLYYAQPLLAALRHSFHIGAGDAGALVTATQLGYAAGMLFLVPLGDRTENRRLVSALLAITTIALVGAAVAPSFGVLVGAGLVAGATSVVVQILIPFAANFAPERSRGRIVGRVVGGLLTGVLLSRVVGSAIAELAGWRVVFAMSAAAMAALALTLRIALPARRPPSATVRYIELLRSTLRLVRAHSTLRRRALSQAAMFGAFSAFWTTITFVLTSSPFHYSQLGVALFALVGAGGAAAAPLAGRWADRGQSGGLTRLAALLAVTAFALAAIGRHHVVLLGLAAVALDIAVQASFVFGQHAIYRLDPAARARLNSIYVATFFAGGAIGSQVAAVTYHAGGWFAVCGIAAAFPMLTLLIRAAG